MLRELDPPRPHRSDTYLTRSSEGTPFTTMVSADRCVDDYMDQSTLNSWITCWSTQDEGQTERCCCKTHCKCQVTI